MPAPLSFAGQTRDPRDRVAIDRSYDSVAARRHVVAQAAERGGRRRRSLQRPDALHLSERRAGIEQLARAIIAAPAVQPGIEFEHLAGQVERPLAQIRRRVVLAAQHLEHVARLQHGPDAAPHRLRAVGQHDADVHAQPLADEFEQLAQAHRAVAMPDLGGGAHRDIDDQAGRAGGGVLGKDGGDHLLGRIDAQRPLDRDQDVVGRRKIDVPAPDQAALFGADNLADLVDFQVDPRQHLHRVGGAGRRGDRAR